MADVRDPEDPYDQDLGEGGLVPPDKPQGVEDYGTTAEEQAVPEPHEAFAKREEPDRWPERQEADPSEPAEEAALHIEEP